MAVQLSIEYEQLIVLIEQLTNEQRNDLLVRLLTHKAQERPLTAEEKIQLLDAAKLHLSVNEEPSLRREDWYGDDGR